MADDADFSTSGEPSLQQLATFLADELFDVQRLRRVENALRNAHGEGATIAHAAQVKATTDLTTAPEDLKALFGKLFQGAAAWLLSSVVENTFEVDVSQTEFAQLGATQGRRAVARALSTKMVEGLTGGSTSVEASAQPAANYLGVVVGHVFESWAVSEMIEIASAFAPFVDKIEHLEDLNTSIVAALGISDSSSRVLRPYIDNLVVEPLRRYIHQTYRPNLLSPGEAIDLQLRGLWSETQVKKELSQQGYTDDRINALMVLRGKYLSIDDALVLVREGLLNRPIAVQALLNQGWDSQIAEFAVTAAETRRLAAIRDNSLTAIARAYINRDIPEGEFQSLLPGIITDTTERASFTVAAQTERALNVKHLTHAEVQDCVSLGILPTAFYRDWLVREGYPDDEAFALELRLRTKIDQDTVLEEHRKQLLAERAAAAAAKQQAALDRQAAVEAERALHRRGSLSDLNRAVVRGLIPISRLEEVLNAQYDADTVGVLVGLVEGDRQTYLEQQQKAEDAKQRGVLRHIDVGALEQAVLNDVLTVPEFRQQLDALGFAAPDADILTATLQARKTDLDAARATRLEAETRAKTRSIDLGRAERLVRRGAGTLAQYDQLLGSLGFDDASRAAMVELLQLEMADDAEARRVRDAKAGEVKPIGLTLEQMRRAVLLGVQTLDQFQTYLVTEHYTSDAQLVLLSELRRDVADAESARAKRAAADRAAGAIPLSLTRVHQAARLGLITPATYQARLVRDGYTPDDIAIELELLLVEIADVQAARARADAIAAKLDAPKELSLEQIAHAVRVGTAPIGDFAAAAADVYAPEDVQLLVETLSAELATLDDARARRVTIDGELTARTLSIGDLEAAVKSGFMTLDGYRAQLVAWGYGSDDADLLAALLLERLSAAGPKP